MVVRARYDGKVLIPLDPVDLPIDRALELEVREATDPPRGSAQALLQAMRQAPHLQPGDAEALMEAIESGKLPPQQGGIFDIDDSSE